MTNILYGSCFNANDLHTIVYASHCQANDTHAAYRDWVCPLLYAYGLLFLFFYTLHIKVFGEFKSADNISMFIHVAPIGNGASKYLALCSLLWSNNCPSGAPFTHML